MLSTCAVKYLVLGACHGVLAPPQVAEVADCEDEDKVSTSNNDDSRKVHVGGGACGAQAARGGWRAGGGGAEVRGAHMAAAGGWVVGWYSRQQGTRHRLHGAQRAVVTSRAGELVCAWTGAVAAWCTHCGLVGALRGAELAVQTDGRGKETVSDKGVPGGYSRTTVWERRQQH